MILKDGYFTESLAPIVVIETPQKPVFFQILVAFFQEMILNIYTLINEPRAKC